MGGITPAAAMLTGAEVRRADEVLTPPALAFLTDLPLPLPLCLCLSLSFLVLLYSSCIQCG